MKVLSWLRRSPQPTEDGLPVIAVVGPLRCGTNLVTRLLESHWQVKVAYNAFGWKHAPLPVLAAGSGLDYPDIPILHVSKNPYAFAVALFRYLRLAEDKGHRISLEGKPEFDAFLTSPITIFDSQLPQSPRLRFANPIDYWNAFCWSYETLDPAVFRPMRVTFESLIEDPESLAGIEDLLPLKRIASPVSLPEMRMDRASTAGKTRKPGEQAPFDADYVRQRKYLEDYTDAQLDFVTRTADPWLMEQRGYAPV